MSVASPRAHVLGVVDVGFCLESEVCSYQVHVFSGFGVFSAIKKPCLYAVFNWVFDHIFDFGNFCFGEKASSQVGVNVCLLENGIGETKAHAFNIAHSVRSFQCAGGVGTQDADYVTKFL